MMVDRPLSGALADFEATKHISPTAARREALFAKVAEIVTIPEGRRDAFKRGLGEAWSTWEIMRENARPTSRQIAERFGKIHDCCRNLLDTLGAGPDACINQVPDHLKFGGVETGGDYGLFEIMAHDGPDAAQPGKQWMPEARFEAVLTAIKNLCDWTEEAHRLQADRTKRADRSPPGPRPGEALNVLCDELILLWRDMFGDWPSLSKDRKDDNPGMAFLDMTVAEIAGEAPDGLYDTAKKRLHFLRTKNKRKIGTQKL